MLPATMTPRKILPWFAAVLGLLLLSACNYDAPLTAQPTHPIDPRLLGEWVTQDGDKIEHLLVRRLDDADYVLVSDGDVYRAFHSDFAGQPFVSVQNLQPGSDDRKYAYVTWRLSPDNGQLVLRCVSNKVIPEQATDTAGMQRLIKQKIADPALLGEELTYHRPAAGGH